MSRHLINEYRAELDRLRSVTGSTRETNLRPAFARLLRSWGKQDLDLVFVEEHHIRTAQGNLISVDGALLHALRVPFGYWEAKDERDDLEAEIAAKLRKGYPRDNIVFSDDRTAVLYQDGREVDRVDMGDVNALFDLLSRFFAHERQEIADFNKAVAQFATDLPSILEALRKRIAEKRVISDRFVKAEAAFLQHARDAINPAVTASDVQEMLIQHVLTEDIFAKVFDNPDFHQHNNIAAELKKVEDALFGRGEKAQLLRALAPYYSGISSAAALISSHSEKQGFLKALYEDFYKAYNRKAADRLGVVYTPGEIVRFMVRSADWLCEKHFSRSLIDRGVEILDPATGTGTFIVELLEHFRGDAKRLQHKYKEELHANEVAILPYYVANLNIEATYQALLSRPSAPAAYEEFANLCFVDTLDNVAALGIYSGHQFDLLGSLSDENIERIKRQNRRKISVIIGNPPYNAWQEGFNQGNPNRPYQRVDERIGQTYRRLSSAQNTSALNDMYVRFWRWASDRLGDEGIVAFITNRNFIEKSSFDGFRKAVQGEYSEIWVMDLGGDVRANPRLSGTKHNVFGIQTGVAIAFMVKTKDKPRSPTIYYARRPEDETADDKLGFLSQAHLSTMQPTMLKPDSHGNWLRERSGAWDSFLPLALPELGASDTGSKVKAICRLMTNGVQTKRDEWVYDVSKEGLTAKIRFFLQHYTSSQLKDGWPDDLSIKWDDQLIRRKSAGEKLVFDEGFIRHAYFRPFVRKWLYFDPRLMGRKFRLGSFFSGSKNPTITFLSLGSDNELAVLAADEVFDLGYLKKGNGGTNQAVARNRITKSGALEDNITDWGLNKFIANYGRKGVSKDAIFAYVYAVLHDPVYRELYADNLRSEFPRIPFYSDFSRWVAWGNQLLALHLGYSDAKPWPLKREDTSVARSAETPPKAILKSSPAKGSVAVDSDTRLSGIPVEAWDYKLGSRSAIDWVLDQYKEKKPRDATIMQQFNSYRLRSHKDEVIDILGRVVHVSLETVSITKAMRALVRDTP